MFSCIVHPRFFYAYYVHVLLVVAAFEELPLPSTFSVEDVLEIIGYRVSEEGKLVAYGKVMNVEGGTLYEITIYEGCVSVEV